MSFSVSNALAKYTSSKVNDDGSYEYTAEFPGLSVSWTDSLSNVHNVTAKVSVVIEAPSSNPETPAMLGFNNEGGYDIHISGGYW